MTSETEYIARALLIGAGATAFMDLWALLMKRGFGQPALNLAMVGRWVGHLPRGRWVHASIAQASPIHAERTIGWVVHYAVGVIFAGLLLATAGLDWARQPSFLPAISFGILTVAAPFLVLQPGMGAGVAAAKTPKPNVARLRSLMAHASFGVGLYAAAWAATVILR
ncbi:DUF2938 domain-containing protein [Variovorax sp. M-6]|uniref:DUF2938 domain-containing protein n=1 Tax=Variovorax sp. M-6 TaxID=3233041 RepID=UPI003F9EA69D